MIRVNLLAADRPTGKKKKAASAPATPGSVQAYLLLTVLAGGAVLVCLVAYLYMSGQIRELDSKIAAAEQRQRELQAIKKQVDELEQKRATFQRKVDLIYRLQAEQQGPVHLLDELSRALPDFVWLGSLDQTGNQIRLSGQSNSLTSVADFITALQQAGADQYGCGKANPLDRSLCWFPEVNLVSSTEANSLVTFALQATFSNPDAIMKQRQNATKPIPGASPAPGAAAPAAPR
jgi:type IV pilus assembly protein PilN